MGNDVSRVAIPLTGSIGVGPYGTVLPTSAEGASLTLTLDKAIKQLGLFTTDGGPEWTLEADGDPLAFWQDGYTVPTGLANATVKVTCAQTDDWVREVVRGRTPDTNGYITIDAAGTTATYVLFCEEVFKNGWIRRRKNANTTIKSVKEAKSTRGEVLGYEVEFALGRHADHGNDHLGEWLIAPVGTVVPSVTSANPANAGDGATLTLTGSGFIGTTGITVGGALATPFTVVSDTQVTLTMPIGDKGSAPIVVTNAAGSSAAFAYTRGA